MKISLRGKLTDVRCVTKMLVTSKLDSPSIMIIYPGMLEGFCADIVTDVSLDDIAKIKDLIS